MTQEQTLQIKGIAILMMLYVHLFHSTENVELCTYWLHYGSTPLFQKLTRCATPVPFFLIISGYGFMKALMNKRQSRKTKLQRILNLYIPYWTVTTIMCIIALCINGKCIDFSFQSIINNITAINTTYNPHCWFILPYLLLAIFSHSICQFIQNNKAITVFLIGLICHITTYAVLDYWDEFLHNNLIILLAVNWIYLLFPFFLGALLAKYTWHIPTRLSKTWGGKHPQVSFSFCLLLVVFAKLHFPGTVNPIYAIAFVFFFIKLSSIPVITPCLKLLGKYSLGMWFIHGWLLNVFLYDTLFSLRYPIIIFITLILMSLLAAYILDYLQKIAKLKIHRLREV